MRIESAPAVFRAMLHHLRDECLNMEAHGEKFFGALLIICSWFFRKEDQKNPELKTTTTTKILMDTVAA